MLLIVFTILGVMVLGNLDFNVKKDIIAPSCFEKLDCKVDVSVGYCSVKYDCEVGKCFSEQIRCPEICSGYKDEDYDGKIDCEDPDCYKSTSCGCENSGYSLCKIGSCYCQFGTPHWVVKVDKSAHWCQCI